MLVSYLTYLFPRAHAALGRLTDDVRLGLARYIGRSGKCIRHECFLLVACFVLLPGIFFRGRVQAVE